MAGLLETNSKPVVGFTFLSLKDPSIKGLLFEGNPGFSKSGPRRTGNRGDG